MAEIAAELDEGKSDDSIVSHFAEKFGLSVLSAPPASGFNLTAWIMPFAALLAGAMLVVYFIRRFRAKWSPRSSARLCRYCAEKSGPR